MLAIVASVDEDPRFKSRAVLLLSLGMIPTALSEQICEHLASRGFELINMPDPPEDGPADAVFVMQKQRVRYLFLVAVVSESGPYYTTPAEQAAQYILQKQQHAAHSVVITVAGDTGQITYPSSL